MSEPSNTRDEDARAARALAAVRLGDEPLVPDDAQRQGPAAMVAAALRKLADLKRARTQILYHRTPSIPPDEGPQP
ncbi:MAG TPA: hypothetical protein VN524_14270 [Hyphomicrobiaceae bacterium]|jgi:hypothetical protein|nr:hypothetical protein [Hyphomicrobiaceae bacterium]